MPKYKESKSRSCVLKMPSCFPCAPQELACLEQTTVRGMQFWQYCWQCTSSPSVANSTQKFPLWDKGERGSIPSAVSHSWIKSVLLLWCRLSSSHTFIRLKWLAWTQAIFIIAYLNQHSEEVEHWSLQNTTRAEQKRCCHIDENGKGASLSTMINNSTVILMLFKDPQ